MIRLRRSVVVGAVLDGIANRVLARRLTDIREHMREEGENLKAHFEGGL